MQYHRFSDDLTRSERDAQQPFWNDLYQKMFPEQFDHAEVNTDLETQRRGVDRVITLKNGRRWLVEEKLREKDYGDILLEYWSILEQDKPGWTVNNQALTQILAYGVKPANRFFVFMFTELRAAARAHHQEWAKQYGYQDSLNEGYITRNIAVPIPVLQSLLRIREYHVDMGGTPTPQPRPQPQPHGRPRFNIPQRQDRQPRR